MVLFFQRTLDTVRDRYRNILRIETIKFDPLVSKYFEGEYTVNGTTSGEVTKVSSLVNGKTRVSTEDELHNDYTREDMNGESDFSKDGTETNTKTSETTGDNLIQSNDTYRDTRTTTGNNSNSSVTTDHTAEVTANTGTSSNINHEAVKQAPMNASGVQTIGSGPDKGKLANLDFDYASMYKQDDSTGATTQNTTDTTDGSSSTTGSGTSTTNASGNTTSTKQGSEDIHSVTDDSASKTYHDEGGDSYTDQKETDNSGNWHKTKSETDSGNTHGTDNTTNTGSAYQIKHDRYTGRDNVLPQDALKSAMNYLQNYSTAFEWLCNKLEINFIGIYDI